MRRHCDGCGCLPGEPSVLDRQRNIWPQKSQVISRTFPFAFDITLGMIYILTEYTSFTYSILNLRAFMASWFSLRFPTNVAAALKAQAISSSKIFEEIYQSDELRNCASLFNKYIKKFCAFSDIFPL